MLGLLLVTVTSGASTGGSPAAASLGWFYRPPANVEIRELATHAQRYILTHLDEPLRDGLRDLGEPGPFLQYVRFEAIMDNTELDYTWQNQVAHREGDWEFVSEENPDWFLLDTNGDRMPVGSEGESDGRFYYMDPANPGWRAFFLERLQAFQEDNDWDGVFLDNVEASLAKQGRQGRTPARYPTDAAWTAAVEDFLRYVSEWAREQGRPLEVNVVEDRDVAGEVRARFLRHVDGVMTENWLGDDLPWAVRLDRAEETQRAGKHVWLIANGEREDEEEQRFAYASFLMVDENAASFRYTAYDSYNQFWLYDTYATTREDLGPPTGPRMLEGDSWRREFENGTVTVDPQRRRAVIEVES